MRFLILFFSVLLYASIGQIQEIKGKVDVLRSDKVIHAKKGFSVDVNDTVFTYQNSKAKIVFKDNTIITIGQNSTFKIKDYVYGKKPKARFSFLKGSFVSVTGKIGKIAPKRFKLETKNASIGIRGTIVFGQLYFGGDIVGCSSGLISVAKGGKTVLVKPGEMVGVFGNVLTKPLKVSYGYLKSVFNSLSLSPGEIKSFFGKIIPSFSYSNVSVNQKISAKENNESNISSNLSWENYKIEKLNTPKTKQFKAIIFDNGLQFENLKYK